MNFRFKRSYSGPVQAVIFDWAGTVVDYGSLAPIDGFCMLFEQNSVPISHAEARVPMGTEKYEHICQLLAMPRIQQAWINVHGKAPEKADTDRLYKQFVPIQIEAINKRAELIPGAKETFDYLQLRNIRVGSNTGYSQAMIEGLIAKASAKGFSPESIVAATDVPRGRPYPHMTLKNLIELEVENLQACIKVDDTIPGIYEGLNAGLWTVGVSVSGNEAGIELFEWQTLSTDEQNAIRQKGEERLYQAGAHYVIDSVADLPDVIDDIERRLLAGEQP
ncbi:phosphonoacetaldehyde hydrolase [Endozoicomonas sp. OPT23]|uniref:phosphonoacetaldehyde hydrolase n=1 Tax=Endozoicomonas sp. OPT23 TaxID=2072845 RepID=UPI00129BCE67|nr:phosphonoacetaldehyde hydrolase [Endozoicomonas sp. OPT23]MRI31791.1 phosphonoacetaldehyde hydrolase [Endozoicomonas sp. OPT23]